MFFMARKRPELCFFDEDFKAGGNHASGFIELKKEGKWKIGFTFDVTVNHDHSLPNKTYLPYRSRRRDDWFLFYEKTGYRYGVFDRKQVRDYVDKKTMKYEEFMKIIGE